MNSWLLTEDELIFIAHNNRAYSFPLNHPALYHVHFTHAYITSKLINDYKNYFDSKKVIECVVCVHWLTGLGLLSIIPV